MIIFKSFTFFNYLNKILQKKKMRILKNKQNENFINEKQWENFEKTKNEHFEKEKKNENFEIFRKIFQMKKFERKRWKFRILKESHINFYTFRKQFSIFIFRIFCFRKKNCNSPQIEKTSFCLLFETYFCLLKISNFE